MILEVALVAPYRRRRLALLARHHKELLAKLAGRGLVEEYSWMGGVEPLGDENGLSTHPIDDDETDSAL